MCRVLVCVDDRFQTLQVRKSNLESLGFWVVTATTVPMAIAALQQTDRTAVLLDCNIEGLHPDDAGCSVKQRLGDKPLLVLSASSGSPERIHWTADEHVIRSEGVGRLLEVVERITHLSQQAEAVA